MHEIDTIIQHIRDQLIEKLSQMDRMLCRHCQINEEDAKTIIILLQTQGIIDEIGIIYEDEQIENTVFFEKLSRCDFNEFNNYKKNIVDFLKSLCVNMFSVEFNDLSEIMKLVSDMVTENTIRIIDSSLTLS